MCVQITSGQRLPEKVSSAEGRFEGHYRWCFLDGKSQGLDGLWVLNSCGNWWRHKLLLWLLNWLHCISRAFEFLQLVIDSFEVSHQSLVYVDHGVLQILDLLRLSQIVHVYCVELLVNLF